MFDAQVDAVRATLDAKGYKDVDIVVAETGWPHKGNPDEAGATVENARAFVSHLHSLSSTPRAPDKSVVTYIFAMYDEDLKPGKALERYFGLFQTSLSETYPMGLLRNGTAGLTPSTTPAPTMSAAVLKLGQQPQVGLQYDTRNFLIRVPPSVQVTPAQQGSTAAACPSGLCKLGPGTTTLRGPP
jgi:hypothetical protein